MDHVRFYPGTPEIPFNSSGGLLLKRTIDQCCAGKNLTNYGELVLHLVSQMSSERAQKLLESMWECSDEQSIQLTLSYINALLENSNSKKFWQQSLDSAVQSAGLYAMEIWKQMGLPTDKHIFNELQSLIFGAGVINFVAVASRDKSSRALIERSLKRGFLGGLFG